MTRRNLACFAFLLTAVGGCGRTENSNPGATNGVPGTPAGKHTGTPHLEPGELSVEEIAEVFDCKVFVFTYSGGRAQCWFEIVETYDEGVKHLNPRRDESERLHAHDTSGKIVLWWKPGEIALKNYSKVGASFKTKTMAENRLWWGLGKRRITISKIDRHVTPELGETVTLLHYKVVNRKDSVPDPEYPRTVTVTLKAEFPK